MMKNTIIKVRLWGSKGRLYQGLPPFIADSQPDNCGNKDSEMSEWMGGG